MTLVGRYVDTFQNATHALPQGMSMNADYPFMLPKIAKWTPEEITLEGRGGETRTIPIVRVDGIEYAELAQTSTYERMFRRKPTTFRFLPFRENL